MFDFLGGEGLVATTPTSWPSAAQDWWTGPLDLNDLVLNRAATEFVRVQGHAFAAEGIFDGDLLLVDRSMAPTAGAMVMASTVHELVLGRLDLQDGRWCVRTSRGAWALGESARIEGIIIKAVHVLSGPLVRPS